MSETETESRTAFAIRRAFASDPLFDHSTVLNIELVRLSDDGSGVMALDLADGTTVRIDFTRYQRETGK